MEMLSHKREMLLYKHLELCLCVQPAVLQALHMMALQGKRCEAAAVMKEPLSHLEQNLRKSSTQFLTSVSLIPTHTQDVPCYYHL